VGGRGTALRAQALRRQFSKPGSGGIVCMGTMIWGRDAIGVLEWEVGKSQCEVEVSQWEVGVLQWEVGVLQWVW